MMNNKILIWIIVILSAFFSASIWIVSKWLLTENIAISSVFLLTQILYAITAFLIFLGCNDRFELLSKDFKENIKIKHLLAIITFSICASLFVFLFLQILKNNDNVAVLSPSRLIMTVIFMVFGSILVLSEEINKTTCVALSFMVIGVIIMIYNSSVTDSSKIITQVSSA